MPRMPVIPDSNDWKDHCCQLADYKSVLCKHCSLVFDSTTSLTTFRTHLLNDHGIATAENNGTSKGDDGKEVGETVTDVNRADAVDGGSGCDALTMEQTDSSVQVVGENSLNGKSDLEEGVPKKRRRDTCRPSKRRRPLSSANLSTPASRNSASRKPKGTDTNAWLEDLTKKAPEVIQTVRKCIEVPTGKQEPSAYRFNNWKMFGDYVKRRQSIQCKLCERQFASPRASSHNFCRHLQRTHTLFFNKILDLSGSGDDDTTNSTNTTQDNSALDQPEEEIAEEKEVSFFESKADSETAEDKNEQASEGTADSFVEPAGTDELVQQVQSLETKDKETEEVVRNVDDLSTDMSITQEITSDGHTVGNTSEHQLVQMTLSDDFNWEVHGRKSKDKSRTICKWCKESLSNRKSKISRFLRHLKQKHSILRNNELVDLLINQLNWKTFIVQNGEDSTLSCSICQEQFVSPEASSNAAIAFSKHLIEHHPLEVTSNGAVSALLLSYVGKTPEETAQDVTEAEDVLPFLECIYCAAAITKDSRMFPCFHFVCGACFEKDLTDCRESLSCKKCDKKCALDKVVRMGLIMEKKISTVKRCVICHEPADSFCLECSDDLCPRCAEAHKFVRMTRNHSVMRITTVSDEPEAVCKTHKRRFKWFCLTCRKNACGKCIVAEHNNHSVQRCDAVVCSMKQEVEALSSRLVALADHIGKVCARIEDTEKTWDAHKELCLNELSKCFRKLMLILESETYFSEFSLESHCESVVDKLKLKRMELDCLNGLAKQLAPLIQLIHSLNPVNGLRAATQFVENLTSALNCMVLDKQLTVPEMTPVTLESNMDELETLFGQMLTHHA